MDWAIAYAKAHHHPEFEDRTVWQVFEAERPRPEGGWRRSIATLKAARVRRASNVRPMA
jgi:hypothetical protein